MLIDMNYAIELLEKEKILIQKALEGWEPEHFPEAFKDRNKKLKNINEALEKLRA